jgi:hypothetical protein
MGDPLLHLLGGFIRKGDGQNTIGWSSMPNQIGNPVGHNAGFPRTSTGQHQERTGQGVDGFELWGVQVCHALKCTEGSPSG